MPPKYLFNVCFQGFTPGHKLCGDHHLDVVAYSKKDALDKIRDFGYFIKLMSSIKRKKAIN